jgi:hypothetical protein
MEAFGIGMGLAPWTLSPIAPMRWEHNAETSESVAVYYAPALPSISVLHRGRDAVCNAMLGFFGFSQLELPGGSIVGAVRGRVGGIVVPSGTLINRSGSLGGPFEG